MTNKNENTNVPDSAVEAPAEQMDFLAMAGMESNGTALELVDAEPAPMAISAYTSTMDWEDIAPPVLRLGQGLSPEVQSGEARPGDWLLAGFDPSNQLEIVPLALARRREYRDEENVILCQSQDSINGIGTPGGVCADCAMIQWGGSGKDRKAPPCSFFYSYMIYINDWDAMAILNFKRTAIPTAKVLNSLAARYGFGKIALTLGSKQQQGKKGSYYIPAVTLIKPPQSDVVIARAAEYRAMYGNMG